jgi:hypothetical protein
MTPQLSERLKTVVFLGAGASFADGAPLQNQLFREYFLHYNDLGRKRESHSWDRELATFFAAFFGIDVNQINNVKNANFPTFEEVLGIIEIADSQNESFRNWETAHIVNAQQKPRLQHIHEVLILLIAEILDHKLRDRSTHHPKLVGSLHEAGWLRNTSFISLNYDILIDNALLGAREDSNLDLDYAIEFMNFGRQWKRPRPKRSITLFKLHGSLNWLYCPSCRAIRITPKQKGVCRLKWRPSECICRRCKTLAVPIIIPPTYFKALSNLYLRQIWHAAEQTLKKCSRLVFCGYSFPDADVHIRYLLKRVEVYRQKTPDVYIINEHSGKDDTSRHMEKNRYLRFFRDKSRVHYTQLSFEEFCNTPTSIDGLPNG